MKITNKKYKNLHLASVEERGDNFVIDFLFSSVFGVLIAILTFKNYITAYFIYLSVRSLYYYLFELLYGRTLGKFQTQTKVVNFKGGKPSSVQLLKRNMSRFISIFSGVNDDERAIHDNFSNTFVIKDTELQKIEIKKPLSLIFHLAIICYYIYFFGIKPEQNNIDYPFLVFLSTYFIVSIIRGIKPKISK